MVALSQVSMLSRLPGALEGLAGALISPNILMRSATCHFSCLTVRKLPSHESGFRSLWDYIYVCMFVYMHMVGAHSGRIYFIYSACELPWSQKISAYIISVFKLNHSFWHRFFSSVLELKMPSRFCWFGFEIGNRVTNFNFCVLFEVSSLQRLTFNCMVNKTSTEAQHWAARSRDQQMNSCIEVVSKEKLAGVVWVCSNCQWDMYKET